MRALYALSEEILTADTPTAIARRLSEVLVRSMGVSRVRLYVYDRRARTLEQVSSPGCAQLIFSLDEPPAPPASVAAMAFRNRTLLAVPDSADSPFFHGERSADCPRAALFVPMQGPHEPAGLLELDQNDRPRDFTPTEKAAAQHLANLASIALRGIAWRASQEKLFHGQRLAAAGQLISSIAGQLKIPLEAIAQTAQRLAESTTGPLREELEQLRGQAQSGVETVARMLSFSSLEQGEPPETDLGALMNDLLGSQRSQGAPVESSLPDEPLPVSGSAEQLEALFSNTLAFALEQRDAISPRPVTVLARRFGQMVHVEITYPAAPVSSPRPDPFSVTMLKFQGGLSLGVCRSMARHFGGEMRWIEQSADMARLEVELPCAEPSPPSPVERRAAPRPGARQLTILLVDPDAATARATLTALSSRDHRVVPASSTEEAVDLMRRFRFDTLFCALGSPRVDWLRLFEQARSRAGGFVLLAERCDSKLAESVRDGEGHVLGKPPEGPELDRVLSILAARAGRRAQGKIEA